LKPFNEKTKKRKHVPRRVLATSSFFPIAAAEKAPCCVGSSVQKFDGVKKFGSD
jgi:hypothetical protein